MAEDADEALLVSLGVTAANPDDIARDILAQVEQKARANEYEYVEGSDDVQSALNFLQGDKHVNPVLARKIRVEDRVRLLDKEIEAITEGLGVLEQPDSTDEDSSGEELKKKEKSKKKKEKITVGRVENGSNGGALHLALTNDRLKNLRGQRKQLIVKLKALDRADGTQGTSKDAGQAQGDNRKTLPFECMQGKFQSKGKVKLGAKAVSFMEDDDFDAVLDAANSGFVETKREKLIRLGIVTPFDKVEGFERRMQTKNTDRVLTKEENDLVKRSIVNAAASMAAFSGSRPTTKLLDSGDLPKLEPPTREFRHLRTPFRSRAPEDNDKHTKGQPTKKRKRPLPDKFWRIRTAAATEDDGTSGEDQVKDESVTGEDSTAKKRRRRRLQLKFKAEDDLEQEDLIDGEGEEEDTVLDGGFKIPGEVFNKLFDYQKTGVKWLWELHCQKAGGIIGDEMGLGKTIQVIAFLAGLHYSHMYSPSIVVCPVTLLQQWKREVKKWYPNLTAEVLHDSAFQAAAKVGKAKKLDEEDTGECREGNGDEDQEGVEALNLPMKGIQKWEPLIKRVVQSNSGLLITTYEQLRVVRDKLLDIHWGYAVLDEGHRIRNPDADTTLVCKQLQTVHRIIMTGAPIQNRLTELWSLFDFVFPGKLGVLPVFQAQFSLPIQIGGYANATPLQVSTAYRCAVVLRDLILPYLLRRMKCDVDAKLPKKSEHVLFCSLSEEQRAAYRAFLGSSELEQIFEGSRNSLYGIDILRKICNHPDLLEREHSSTHADYGNPERSGKLKLVGQILDLWKSQGHRVLIFSQTQQMLDIIQIYVESKNYTYRRMDGTTPIKQRMALIDEFNGSNHVYAFILTTKVGGLGTNLVGANRIIIFDPDWNPSTDMQARERAWRIGQTRDVVIYRLISRGTIEEKVYHRQIYKHFLTNKILQNPNQRRFFKAKDMRDLFTLQDDTVSDKTETAEIFAEAAGEVQFAEQKLEATNAGSSSTLSRRRGRSKTGGSIHHQIKSEIVDFEDKEKVEPIVEDPLEEESRILKTLFESNGIHSAINHDAILSVNDTERVRVDQEAARVAQRAAEALRESRMLRASDNISVPTWTGLHGAAGAPAALRRRFGTQTNSRLNSTPSAGSQVRAVHESRVVTSSSTTTVSIGTVAGSLGGRALSSTDLLTRMRERRMGAEGAGLDMSSIVSLSSSSSRFGGGGISAPRATQGSQVLPSESNTLIVRIRTFIEQNGGSVHSSRLVEHFKAQIQPKDVPMFKNVLKEIATLQKDSGGVSRWILKTE